MSWWPYLLFWLAWSEADSKVHADGVLLAPLVHGILHEVPLHKVAPQEVLAIMELTVAWDENEWEGHMAAEGKRHDDELDGDDDGAADGAMFGFRGLEPDPSLGP